VAKNSSDGVPGIGHKRALLDGRFGVAQLMGWGKLLRCVIEIDMERCPNCGGKLKIIAVILEQPVIEKTLTHLGLQARAPPSGASPWPGAANGLTLPNRDRSGNPATRDDGVGGAVNAQQTAAASEDRFKRTKRRAPSRSRCHEKGKRAFEKPILPREHGGAR
jgi:hypothetical protein